MNEPLPEPLMSWRFIRVNAVRIVVGAILAAAVSIAVFVWMPYQRELRIARKIESVGGEVSREFSGPNWIPQVILKRLTVFERIRGVNLDGGPVGGQAVSSDVLSQVGMLTNLEWLILDYTDINDAGLEHLQGLTDLGILELRHTPVTNSGLEHLKGLTNLEMLSLDDTQTTQEGRAILRKALPSCQIVPNP